MKIIKLPKYLRDFKKNLKNKHLKKEMDRIERIENLLKYSNNMKKLLNNPLSKTYNIEKKKGNLKEIYTAKVNEKIRMYIKPVGIYPYNLEEILEVELVEINDNHYGDG